MEIDHELSEWLNPHVRHYMQDVWPRAYLALSKFGRKPGDPLYGAIYVEGRAVTLGNMIYDHGWLELGERIIDPTMWEHTAAYFPGPRWTLAEADEEAKDGVWPFVYKRGLHGTDDLEFIEAGYQASLFRQRMREQGVTGGPGTVDAPASAGF